MSIKSYYNTQNKKRITNIRETEWVNVNKDKEKTTNLLAQSPKRTFPCLMAILTVPQRDSTSLFSTSQYGETSHQCQCYIQCQFVVVHVIQLILLHLLAYCCVSPFSGLDKFFEIHGITPSKIVLSWLKTCYYKTHLYNLQEHLLISRPYFKNQFQLQLKSKISLNFDLIIFLLA